MESAMVTGRMDVGKKERGGKVLGRAGMNPSQAINLMYDRLVNEQSAAFLTPESARPTQADWARAAHVVDSISQPRSTRFDGMTRADVKADRLRSRGLL